MSLLGTRVVRLLAADSRVSEIHCVAIPKHHKAGVVTAEGTVRIFEHAGDLNLPLLGLSRSTFAELAGTVDVIVHNGAQASFLNRTGGTKAGQLLFYGYAPCTRATEGSTPAFC
ncbi:hypothetical protein ANO14919_075430 [Xylariales sp. No.14919]|nr:hypothetical protein ANO14919_075430 [Xylariales sp. No.14919]